MNRKDSMRIKERNVYVEVMEMCALTKLNMRKVEEVRSKMIGKSEAIKISEILKVLSDPTRIKIVSVLSHNELCVCEIALALNVPLPQISHQMRALKHLGLVSLRREGRKRYYSLKNDYLSVILDECKKCIEQIKQWKIAG